MATSTTSPIILETLSQTEATAQQTQQTITPASHPSRSAAVVPSRLFHTNSKQQVQQQLSLKQWLNPIHAIITIGISCAAMAIGVLYGKSSERQNNRNLQLTVWGDCVDLRVR